MALVIYIQMAVSNSSVNRPKIKVNEITKNRLMDSTHSNIEKLLKKSVYLTIIYQKT